MSDIFVTFYIFSVSWFVLVFNGRFNCENLQIRHTDLKTNNYYLFGATVKKHFFFPQGFKACNNDFEKKNLAEKYFVELKVWQLALISPNDEALLLKYFTPLLISIY